MTRSAGRNSIWVWVGGLATVAAVAVGVPGCATRPDWRSILAREARMRPEQRREQLHAVLRTYPEPHDAYIHLMPIADETSVPLLLERFRIDHPMAPPEPEPDPTWVDPFRFSIGRVGPAASNRGIQAFPCVWSHLVDALAYATNTHRGMYFPAWKTWWDENRHKSRAEWIAQGFKEAGLSPSNPIDEQFGLDLIGLLAGPREHLAINARRLLETVPAATRLEWIEKAARSQLRHRRLGAVAALRHLHQSGHEDLAGHDAKNGRLAIRAHGGVRGSRRLAVDHQAGQQIPVHFACTCRGALS
jgi:hypothetical protein